jgi:hypothetical protein
MLRKSKRPKKHKRENSRFSLAFSNRFRLSIRKTQ